MRKLLSALVLVAGLSACAPDFVYLARTGDVEAIRKRLDAGEDQSNKNFGLWFAALEGHLEAAKLLLDGGAQIDVRVGSVSPSTPLIIAANNGHLEVVKLLLDRGADINAAEKGSAICSGFTALHFAAVMGNREMVKLLLERGADPSIADQEGKTAGDHVMAQTPEAREIRELLEYSVRKTQRAKSQAAALATKLSAIQASEQLGDEAKAAGKIRAALTRYSEALSLAPPGTDPDFRLRQKAIACALALSPAPEIPPEAVHHSNKGQAFIKHASGAQDFASAVGELEQAVAFAPWWPAGYFNLGLAREKAQDYDGAIQSMKLYLLAAPSASDAGAVSKKIDELEVLKEQAGR